MVIDRLARTGLKTIPTILTLLVLGVTVGVAAGAAAETWSEYRSAAGRYRVEMPGTPVLEESEVKLAENRGTQMYEATVETPDNEAYLCSYIDYPWDILSGQTPQQILIAARDATLVDEGDVLRSDRTISVAGFPGREYTIDRADTYVLVARTVMVRSRFYQVMVVTPPGRDTRPAVRRFIESFNITSQ
jgi:hypothetical protein